MNLNGLCSGLMWPWRSAGGLNIKNQLINQSPNPVPSREWDQTGVRLDRSAESSWLLCTFVIRLSVRLRPRRSQTSGESPGREGEGKRGLFFFFFFSALVYTMKITTTVFNIPVCQHTMRRSSWSSDLWCGIWGTSFIVVFPFLFHKCWLPWISR